MNLLIKVTDIKESELTFEAKYIKEVRNYDILTNYMSDDCVPYRIHQATMLWISEAGELGEIECIYPIMVESKEPLELSGFPQKHGVPILEVVSSEDAEVWIEYQKNTFIIWLAANKSIQSCIEAANIKFLVTAESELIGILCERVTIE